MPLILFNRRHDYNVLSSLSGECFEPSPGAVQGAHLVRSLGARNYERGTGQVAVGLVHYARPVAERPGDGVP